MLSFGSNATAISASVYVVIALVVVVVITELKWNRKTLPLRRQKKMLRCC
jgi:hypothetical protein